MVTARRKKKFPVRGFWWRRVRVSVPSPLAAELEISYSTVQRHVEHIYGKLHIHYRAHTLSKYLGI
jgi:hypothetical protein